MQARIDTARIASLSSGEVPSSTLAEILKIDFDILLKAIVPDFRSPDFSREGISRKMSLYGEALLNYGGAELLELLSSHASDTVRGLSVFGLAHHHARSSSDQVVAMVRPFAADLHFGVREWAWLAVRPILVSDLDASIGILSTWTHDNDVNIRRFAVEALRPRGVWCKHIADLRSNPSLGLPILEPMRLEAEKYAQDSVANWLNDAAKDNPGWVKDLCSRWKDMAPADTRTKRITTRALRSLS